MKTEHLNSLEHIDPRKGILISGLENTLNEVFADLSYNAQKVNRFVPYRVCCYPPPTSPGDLGEFLIGADIETDTPGEWVVCEFMVKGGPWWQESNRIGNSQTEGGRKVGKVNGKNNIKKIPKNVLAENGRKNGKKASKPVTCVETGKTYPSIMEASRETGINPGNISSSCRRGGKFKGFHWVFS